MARDQVTAPITAKLEATIGDVVLLLEHGRDNAVHPPVTNPDGSVTHFIGEGVHGVRCAALNPALPDFVQQDEVMVEPKSFAAYITAFKSPTAICRASLGSNSIVAVLDYHGRARMHVDAQRDAPASDNDAAVPGRSVHTVKLLCPFDLDYARWRPVFAGKQAFDQDELARFLEDMIHTIAEPTAGDLTEAIADLEIVRHVHFKSARNDRNGNISIAYQELDAEDVPGRDGKLTLPESVTIVVPIFQGGNAVALVAKLRHRMDKGVMAFSLIVPSIDVKEREAFRAIGDGVAADTDTPVFYVA